MKWDCDKRKRERAKKLIEQVEKLDSEGGVIYTTFALFPIKVAPGDCRWLETVTLRRRLDNHGKHNLRCLKEDFADNYYSGMNYWWAQRVTSLGNSFSVGVVDTPV